MSATRSVLSLDELLGFDPHAPQGPRERRFCCPLCGLDKPRDAAHRSVSVAQLTGLWYCHRCGEGGQLREHWQERPRDRRRRARAQLRRALVAPEGSSSSLPPSPPARVPPDGRRHLHGLQLLAGTPAAAYLAHRLLPADLAHAAGARYSPAFFDRPAVLFPIRARNGELLAAQGRYLDGREDPKARTVGPKARGVFATPGAWNADPWILCEAPMDALTLAAAGYPALATLGCDLPDWLAWACAMRDVRLALDADAAGETAARAWRDTLMARGATVRRLRPVGAKDWNELLIAHGPAALKAALGEILAPARQAGLCPVEK